MKEEELTCKELTELITDYLEDCLSQVERLRFEQHLSICSGCVAYLDQMCATIRAIGSKPALELPAAMQSNLMEAFRRWKSAQH